MSSSWSSWSSSGAGQSSSPAASLAAMSSGGSGEAGIQQEESLREGAEGKTRRRWRPAGPAARRWSHLTVAGSLRREACAGARNTAAASLQTRVELSLAAMASSPGSGALLARSAQCFVGRGATAVVGARWAAGRGVVSNGCKGQDFLNTISTAYAERRLVAENIILPNKHKEEMETTIRNQLRRPHVVTFFIRHSPGFYGANAGLSSDSNCVEDMECWQKEHVERYKLRFIEVPAAAMAAHLLLLLLGSKKRDAGQEMAAAPPRAGAPAPRAWVKGTAAAHPFGQCGNQICGKFSEVGAAAM